MLLCSILGCFFWPNAFENAPGHAFENGRAASEGGKSLFSYCFGGFRRAAVSATGPSNMQRRPGATCWKWGIFQEKFRTMTLRPTPSVRVCIRVAVVRRGRTCPELRGEWVFQVCGLLISMERPKTRDLEKWQNIFVLARPSSFCAFWWRAWISPKTGFWKSTNFRWNRWKRSAKRSRFENPFLHGRVWNRPILEVAATWSRNISPWIGTSFPTHLQEDKMNCFCFSCRFPFFKHRPLSIFFMVAFFLQQLLQLILLLCFILLFLLVVFVFCWCLCFWFCFVIPFSLLTSVFLFFVLFFFAFHVFSSCCLSYPPPVFCPCLMFLSVTRPYLVLMFPFVLCFHFVSRLIFLFCVFFSLFLLFLLFCLFFSPCPRVRLRRTTMERTTISFCLPFGDLCRNVLCANLLCIYFLVDFFLFTEHQFVKYSWNMFWGSKGLFVVASYLLLYRCFGVSCRAVTPSFSPTCLLCRHFGGFVLFCVRVLLFCVLLLLSSFVEVYFLGFAYLPHLGLLLLRCCVVVLVFKFYVLAGCLCVSVSVLSFCGEPCGGACG